MAEQRLCPKDTGLKSCRLVVVDLEALKAPKMKVSSNYKLPSGLKNYINNYRMYSQMPLSYADPGANLVLKKVSEEGLDLVLKSEKSRATATVVYKVI